MPRPLIALDFETFYDKEYSLRKMSTWAYVNDPRFDAYLVALHGDGVHWVGDPKKCDWSAIKEAVVVMHNASFDQMVLERLIEQGIVPTDCRPAQVLCTADMTAYLGCKRDLASAAKFLLHKEISKQVRTDMMGKHYQDAVAAGMEEDLLKYGCSDAELCFELAQTFLPQWPETERKISCLNREAGMKGVAIDVRKVEKSSRSLRVKLAELEESLPWMYDPDAKPLSPKAIRAAGREAGIPVPASLAKDDPAVLDWVEKYGEQYPWVKALGQYRSLNILLKRVQSIESNLRADGTMPFQIKYAGAHTLRFSGGGDSGGKFNMQNMYKHEMFGVDLRSMLIPRPGHKFLIADFCVAPATKILKSDMTWVAASEIKTGDELVGFPEYLLKSHEHRYERATVEATKQLIKPCVRVTTSDGPVECSVDHMWLARKRKRRRMWVRADELTTDHSLCLLAKPWEKNDTAVGQWLAGIIDGEGSLSSTRVVTKEGAERINHGSLQIAQKAGLVLDRILEYLTLLGYPYHLTPHKSEVWRVRIPSTATKHLLGSVRPVRFVPRLSHLWEGIRTWNSRDKPARVLSVESIGDQEVVAIQTTTKTFVANGFLSHNCQIEARVLLWRVGDTEFVDYIKKVGNLYIAYAKKALGKDVVKGTFDYAMAKAAVLLLGYYGGWKKFQGMVAKPPYNIAISDEVAQATVKEYRESNPRIVNHWYSHQKWLKISANDMDATHEVALPNGRILRYFEPRNDGDEITAMNERGGNRYKLHAGILTNNEIQSISRDIMCDAWLALDAAGIPVLWSVHDELVCEVPEAQVDAAVPRVRELMTTSSPWAAGCPIDVEIAVADRYCKD